MPIAVAVTWKTKPGHGDEVADALATMARHTREEPGCLYYLVHRSPDDAESFFIYEQYRDDEAARAHQAAPYFKEQVIDRAVPLLEVRQRAQYEPI